MFFAQLAEQAGIDEIELEFDEGKTPRDYLEPMRSLTTSKVVDTLEQDVVMVSINQIFASWDDELHDGDVVGLLPPFSGG